MALNLLAPLTQLVEKFSEEGTTLYDTAIGRATTTPSSWGTHPLNSSLAYFIVEGTTPYPAIGPQKSGNTLFFFLPLCPAHLSTSPSLPLRESKDYRESRSTQVDQPPSKDVPNGTDLSWTHCLPQNLPY